MIVLVNVTLFLAIVVGFYVIVVFSVWIEHLISERSLRKFAASLPREEPHEPHLYPGDIVYIPYDPFVDRDWPFGPTFIVSIAPWSHYNDYGYEVYTAYVLTQTHAGLCEIPAHLRKLNK